MKALVYILIFLPNILAAQILYNPQDLYSSPGSLFEKDSIRTLDVQFEDPNYHNILKNTFFSNPSYRIPATISLNGQSFDSAGVRYKGNSTFCIPNDDSIPKVPYNIDMNHWISGQKLMDYKKIKLANAWTDATFIREYMAAKTYRKYLPSPEVNLMQLNVQGNYLGLYVNTESINKQFTEKHFDEKNGALFKCDPAQVFCGNSSGSGTPDLRWKGNDSTLYYNDYVLKSDEGWAELLHMIDTLNNHFTHIDSVLNVDRVLWAFAVNTVLLNQDTYNGKYIHNYYLYKSKDHQFQMIPWDLSESFIGALLGTDFNNRQNVFYQKDPYLIPNNRPLIKKIMNSPKWRDQYSAHIRTIISEMDTMAIRNEITQTQIRAFNAADNDPHRPQSMARYTEGINDAYLQWIIFPLFGWGYGGIMESIRERQIFLASQAELAQNPPSITNVSVSGNNITAQVFNEQTVTLLATDKKRASKFMEFEMYDDGSNGDVQANDGQYTASIPFYGSGKDVKFYVRANNADALRLSPERAEYEYYIYPQTAVSTTDYVQDDSREVLKVYDILGRETNIRKNEVQLYRYSDGRVEKRMIVE